MNILDWVVLCLTLGFIVIYGTLKTRRNTSANSYLKGNGMSWIAIGLSVMATQASAITFISTPGLAFEKGMSFVQNYFGLPLALIVVSAFFIPIYYRLKVFTAYEYLEHRFDLRLRLLTAFLFLLQRGLAAGITIYAPAIILSSTLNWDLTFTILLVGVLVIIYTVSGGTRAVSVTQKWQMSVILLGMFGVFAFLVWHLSQYFSISEGLSLAGMNGRMNAVSFSLDPNERYTFWTGITGGFFLALSYFGTDQSQVQRYLGGTDVKASRLGLMFNALLKVPMQFFILLIGVLVFLFFEFNPHPVLFNQTALNSLEQSEGNDRLNEYKEQHTELWNKKNTLYEDYLKGQKNEESFRTSLRGIQGELTSNRADVKSLYKEVHLGTEAKESDYVFLYFILNYLPHGVIGLLLCVIISAAMSSTSGEINALATTTSIDFMKRLNKYEASDKRQLHYSKFFTFIWGIFAILFALFAHMIENLIEAVNILGSLFYGPILGIFVVGFFLKWISSTPVFLGAIFSEIIILSIYFFQDPETGIAYLWFNPIGCAGVVLFSIVLNQILNKREG